MDLGEIQRVGIAAAYRSAEILRSRFGKLSDIRKKGAIDLVTEADIASEQCIIETIRATYPDHSILAEESGVDQGVSDHLWLIDPLDGTTNFAHQLPVYAVSIAFAVDGEPVVGVVLNPVSGELFTAAAGSGALLNGRTVAVSEVNSLSDSLLVTGFPYDVREIPGPVMERLEKFLLASQSVRRLGSAALDLCYVACGRFEGYWEQHLKPWDIAAGALIAREAGGAVTDFGKHPYTTEKLEILATNGHIHDQMVALLALKDNL
jgi:myo-inositol-1(or 4)-monophosphatase